MRFFIFILFLIFFSACIYQDPYQSSQSAVIVSRSEVDLSPSTKRGYRRRSLKRSGYSSSSRPRFSSRQPSISSVSLRSNPNLNIEDYLDTAVYILGLNGICDSANDISDHKTCVLACLDDPDTAVTCAGTCDTTHSCRTPTRDGNFTGPAGSGVFVSQTKILTNHHVIEEAIGYEREGKHHYNILTSVYNHSGGFTLLSSVEWYDDENDIALGVLVSSLSGADVPSHSSLSAVRLGEELFTIGNPAGVRWTVSKGHLTNKNPGTITYDGGYSCRHCITFSIPIGRGNSGGPVFDSRGRLIGLVSYESPSHRNLSGGPHIDRIKHLLSSGGTGDLSAVRLLNAEIRSLSRSRQRALARAVKDLVLVLN